MWHTLESQMRGAPPAVSPGASHPSHPGAKGAPPGGTAPPGSAGGPHNNAPHIGAPHSVTPGSAPSPPSSPPYANTGSVIPPLPQQTHALPDGGAASSASSAGALVSPFSQQLQPQHHQIHANQHPQHSQHPQQHAANPSAAGHTSGHHPGAHLGGSNGSQINLSSPQTPLTHAMMSPRMPGPPQSEERQRWHVSQSMGPMPPGLQIGSMGSMGSMGSLGSSTGLSSHQAPPPPPPPPSHLPGLHMPDAQMQNSQMQVTPGPSLSQVPSSAPTPRSLSAYMPMSLPQSSSPPFTGGAPPPPPPAPPALPAGASTAPSAQPASSGPSGHSDHSGPAGSSGSSGPSGTSAAPSAPPVSSGHAVPSSGSAPPAPSTRSTTGRTSPESFSPYNLPALPNTPPIMHRPYLGGSEGPLQSPGMMTRPQQFPDNSPPAPNARKAASESDADDVATKSASADASTADGKSRANSPSVVSALKKEMYSVNDASSILCSVANTEESSKATSPRSDSRPHTPTETQSTGSASELGSKTSPKMLDGESKAAEGSQMDGRQSESAARNEGRTETKSAHKEVSAESDIPNHQGTESRKSSQIMDGHSSKPSSPSCSISPKSPANPVTQVDSSIAPIYSTSQLVKAGILSASDLNFLSQFFFTHLDPFFPIVSRRYSSPTDLIAQPALEATVCAIASRYANPELGDKESELRVRARHLADDGFHTACVSPSGKRDENAVEATVLSVLLSLEWPSRLFCNKQKVTLEQYNQAGLVRLAMACKLAEMSHVLERESAVYSPSHTLDQVIAARLGVEANLNTPRPSSSMLAQLSSYDRARVDVSKSLASAARTLYSSRENTREVVQNGVFLSMLELIHPQFEQWKKDYAQIITDSKKDYQTSSVLLASSSRDRSIWEMRSVMFEFHHCELYVYSLALTVYIQSTGKHAFRREELEEAKEYLTIAAEAAVAISDFETDSTNPVSSKEGPPMRWIVRFIHASVFLAQASSLPSSAWCPKLRSTVYSRVGLAAKAMEEAGPQNFQSLGHYTEILKKIKNQIRRFALSPHGEMERDHHDRPDRQDNGQNASRRFSAVQMDGARRYSAPESVTESARIPSRKRRFSEREPVMDGDANRSIFPSTFDPEGSPAYSLEESEMFPWFCSEDNDASAEVDRAMLYMPEPSDFKNNPIFSNPNL